MSCFREIAFILQKKTGSYSCLHACCLSFIGQTVWKCLNKTLRIFKYTTILLPKKVGKQKGVERKKKIFSLIFPRKFLTIVLTNFSSLILSSTTNHIENPQGLQKCNRKVIHNPCKEIFCHTLYIVLTFLSPNPIV